MAVVHIQKPNYLFLFGSLACSLVKRMKICKLPVMHKIYVWSTVCLTKSTFLCFDICVALVPSIVSRSRWPTLVEQQSPI